MKQVKRRHLVVCCVSHHSWDLGWVALLLFCLEWSGPRVAAGILFVAFGRNFDGGVIASVALGARAAVIILVVVCGLRGLRILLKTASSGALIIGFLGVVGSKVPATGTVGDPGQCGCHGFWVVIVSRDVVMAQFFNVFGVTFPIESSEEQSS